VAWSRPVNLRCLQVHDEARARNRPTRSAVLCSLPSSRWE
jgi:hypothetical protein